MTEEHTTKENVVQEKERRRKYAQRYLLVVSVFFTALLLTLVIGTLTSGAELEPVSVGVLVYILVGMIAGVVVLQRGNVRRAVYVASFFQLSGGLISSAYYFFAGIPRTGLFTDYAAGFIGLVVVVGLVFGALDQRSRNLVLSAAVVISVLDLVFTYIRPLDTAAEGIQNVPVGIIMAGVVVGVIVLFILNSTNIVSWFFSVSLRYKLIAFMSVLIVPSILIISLQTISAASTNIEIQEQQTLAESNSALKGTTETWLEENIHFLNAVSEMPYIVSMDASQQKPILESFDRNNPHVFLVHTTDTTGFNVARNDNGALQDYSDREWFIGPMAGNDLTFQSLISRTIGEQALAVSVPIVDGYETVGVLQMALEFSELTDAIGAIELGETGSSFIVDANNTLIAHTDQTYFEAEELVDFSDNPLVQALREGQTGIIHYVDEHDVPRMAYVDVLDEYGWGTVVSITEEEIQAPITEMRNRAFIVMAAVLVPALFLVWGMASLTVNPISDLIGYTKEYAAGNFDVRANVNSTDEIGSLASAFNQMAAEVGAQTAALAERAQEMEASQRVTFAASERTTPDDFLDLLVNLIVDQFDVYHSQIYMVDDENKNAVLSKSTGYAGRVLLQRKHQIPLERESLVTRCISTAEPVLVGNTTAEEGWLANELLPYTQSELVVPIKIEDQVIGALDIQAREPDRFTEETVPVFESMIEQVAFLYQNNTLLEGIEAARKDQEQFVKQLETASQVAGQLTTILDPTQLLDQAVSMLQSNFNFYHAHIYLLDESGEKLVVAAGSGHVGVILKERGHGIPVEAERSFVARAFRERAPVRIEDTTADPNWLPNALLPDTHSEMAVPLITRGQVIGVLDIQSEEVGRFTVVDEDTMLTLAGQLATSVDTARLFEDVEQNAERDRVRFEIAEALSGNPTEEEVWDILLEKSAMDNALINLYEVVSLPDGDRSMDLVRSKSSDSKLPQLPIGASMKFSEHPNVILNIGGFSVNNDVLNDAVISTDPELYASFEKQGVQSMMTAWFGDSAESLMGSINIRSTKPGMFTDDVAAKYQSLVELGTIALQSAKLRASIDRAARRTATRLDVTQAMGGTPNEQEVLNILLEKSALYPEAGVTIYYEDGTSDVRVIECQAENLHASNVGGFGVGFRISDDVLPFADILPLDDNLVFTDLEKDERVHPAMKAALQELNIVSLASFPMRMGNDWTGHVFAYSHIPNYFDDEKLTLYSILATVGETALREARLRSVVAQSARVTATRLDVTQALTGNPTEQEILDILVDKASLYQDARITIYYEDFDAEVRTIEVQRDEAFGSGLTVLGEGYRISNDMMNFTDSLKIDVATVYNNVKTDDQLDESTKDIMERIGYTSLATFPMHMGEDWLGYIFVSSKEEEYFDEDKLALYEVLAQAGEISLRAARLRAAVATSAERDRMRFEIAEALAGNLTVDQVFDALQEKALQGNVSVVVSKVETLPDGDKLATTMRSKSNTPELFAAPVGYNLRFSENPEFVNQTGFGEFTIINDLDNDPGITANPEFYEEIKSAGVKSLLSAWLGSSLDDVIGYISIQSSEIGFFDDQTAFMYQSLIELGEEALRSANLRAAIDAAAERDRYRFEVAEALSGNLSVDEVWDVLLEKAIDDADNVSVVISRVDDLPDGDREGVIVRSKSMTPDLTPAPLGYKTKFSENPHFAATVGVFEVTNDINTDEDTQSNPELFEAIKAQGVNSMMAAWFGDTSEDVVGSISIQSTEINHFDERLASRYQSLVELGTDAIRAAILREQREAERQRFEALITYAPDAILMMDSETYIFKDANKNAEIIYGLPREELLKINPGDVSPEFQPDGSKSADMIVEHINHAVTTGSSQFEWIHVKPDGTPFTCEVRLALLPGGEKNMLVNVTDITDRKQAQQAIVQGDRLKSEFLANMSHELRTPLNSILGYTDVLLMGLDGDLEDDVRIDLEAIHENSQHLLRLINDILDLAKIEAGRMTLSLGEVNIPQVLEELRRNNAGLLVGKEVELVVDASEELPTMVADERRVYQVVNNLVSNAAKFTEKGSITMRAFEENGEMILQVEDTGMGIDKENLEAIFEEFTQVDTSSTRQHEGTGLGLTITRRLVHMHGGTIGVDSEFGKGSVFTVRLPLEAKVDPELLSMVVSSTNGSNGSSKKGKAKSKK